MVVILFVLGGAGVDFIRFTTLRSELQSASDSAVLAAASLSNERSPIVVANEYFEANFNAERFSLDPSAVNFTPLPASNNSADSRTVTATANVEMPTFFLKILDIFNNNPDSSFATLSIAVNSSANEAVQNLEIAMVLDTSISMANGGRIENLRSAGQAFIDTVFDNSDAGLISVSIIPFSSNVNIEPVFLDFAPSSFSTTPITRPCLIYNDFDFNSLAFTGITNPVDQSDTPPIPTGRHRCSKTPVIFNTDDRELLKSTIANFEAGGRTDAHIGLSWGVRALSPAFRGRLGGDFSRRPARYSDRTIKTLIVMSDGQMNPIPDEDGTVPVTEAENQFRAMCDEARDNRIFVFTIGFQITAGSNADILLQDCAASISQYFFVESLDLETAFESIAASLSRLRISE